MGGHCISATVLSKNMVTRMVRCFIRPVPSSSPHDVQAPPSLPRMLGRSVLRTSAALSSAASRGAATLSSTGDYLGMLDNHFSPAVPRSPKGNNIVVDYAKGSWIHDITGKKYLDMQTGIGVANTGHCHPRVVKAVQEQVAKGIHLQQNCTISRPVVQLLDKLTEVMPEGLTRYFFNCEKRGARCPRKAAKGRPGLLRYHHPPSHFFLCTCSFHSLLSPLSPQALALRPWRAQ